MSDLTLLYDIPGGVPRVFKEGQETTERSDKYRTAALMVERGCFPSAADRTVLVRPGALAPVPDFLNIASQGDESVADIHNKNAQIPGAANNQLTATQLISFTEEGPTRYEVLLGGPTIPVDIRPPNMFIEEFPELDKTKVKLTGHIHPHHLRFLGNAVATKWRLFEFSPITFNQKVDLRNFKNLYFRFRLQTISPVFPPFTVLAMEAIKLPDNTTWELLTIKEKQSLRATSCTTTKVWHSAQITWHKVFSPASSEPKLTGPSFPRPLIHRSGGHYGSFSDMDACRFAIDMIMKSMQGDSKPKNNHDYNTRMLKYDCKHYCCDLAVFPSPPLKEPSHKKKENRGKKTVGPVAQQKRPAGVSKENDQKKQKQGKNEQSPPQSKNVTVQTLNPQMDTKGKYNDNEAVPSSTIDNIMSQLGDKPDRKIAEALAKVSRSSLAGNTKKVYRSMAKEILHMFPDRPDMFTKPRKEDLFNIIGRFLIMDQVPKALRVIAGYGGMVRAMGGPLSITKHPDISILVTALKNQNHNPAQKVAKRKRKAFCLASLSLAVIGIENTKRWSAYQKSLCKTTLLLCFFGRLRGGECLSQKFMKGDVRTSLLRSDVKVSETEALLWLRCAKYTEENGAIVQIPNVEELPDNVNPIKALNEFIEMRDKISTDGALPFFLSGTKSKNNKQLVTFYTSRKFSKDIRRAIRGLGPAVAHKMDDLIVHSLR